jgi:hypothetical protein
MSASTGVAPTEAEICFGAVMHRRCAPVENGFIYPYFCLRLPLSKVGQLASSYRPFFAINRKALLRLDDRDHGARDGSPPLPWVRAVLARHGVMADGEVVLQTLPRMFGYGFNPVSFLFCHDVAGALRAVVCEVNNTFGEYHNYLVAHADGSPILCGEELRARKVFHVSPFFPVRGEYRFRFRRHGRAHSVAVDYWDGGIKMLTTRLSVHSAPLNRNSLLRALLRSPFMTVGVMARIHWQALRLWSKRVTFFRKPHPPLEETTR